MLAFLISKKTNQITIKKYIERLFYFFHANSHVDFFIKKTQIFINRLHISTSLQNRFAVDRLKDREVASRYYDELKSELQGVEAQPLGLDEKCKKLEETIQRVATNTIGYTRKQAYKEWFDEECAEVKEEKNAARERAIQNNTRGAKKAYKLARTRECRLFRKGKAARQRGFNRD
jgi:hypothetical protein